MEDEIGSFQFGQLIWPGQFRIQVTSQWICVWGLCSTFSTGFAKTHLRLSGSEVSSQFAANWKLRERPSKLGLMRFDHQSHSVLFVTLHSAPGGITRRRWRCGGWRRWRWRRRTSTAAGRRGTAPPLGAPAPGPEAGGAVTPRPETRNHPSPCSRGHCCPESNPAKTRWRFLLLQTFCFRRKTQKLMYDRWIHVHTEVLRFCVIQLRASEKFGRREMNFRVPLPLWETGLFSVLWLVLDDANLCSTQRNQIQNTCLNNNENSGKFSNCKTIKVVLLDLSNSAHATAFRTVNVFFLVSNVQCWKVRETNMNFSGGYHTVFLKGDGQMLNSLVFHVGFSKNHLIIKICVEECIRLLC